jgi:hypothetical protein
VKRRRISVQFAASSRPIVAADYAAASYARTSLSPSCIVIANGQESGDDLG